MKKFKEGQKVYCLAFKDTTISYGCDIEVDFFYFESSPYDQYGPLNLFHTKKEAVLARGKIIKALRGKR